MSHLLPRVFLAAFLIFAIEARAGKVLIIGDSLSCEGAYGLVGFGVRLSQNLSANGDEVTLYCMEGSAPEHWLEGKRVSYGRGCVKSTTPNYRGQACSAGGVPPTLQRILSDFNGNRVVVALGTNSLGRGTADGAYVNMAAAIRRSGKTCEWIGPPAMNTRYGRPQSQTLQNNLAPFYVSLIKPKRGAESRPYVSDYCGKITDSRPATSSGPGNDTDRGAAGNDGIHRSARAGVYWANQIYPAAKKIIKENPARPTAGAE